MENNEVKKDVKEVEVTHVTDTNVTDKEVVKPLVDVEAEAAKAAEEKPGFFKKVGNGIKANKGKIIGGTVAVISAVGGFALGRKVGVKSVLSSIAQAQATPEDYIPDEATDEDDQVTEEEI
jgi:hypothetical protein